MSPLDDKSTAALDSCRAAEEKIQEAQRLLSTAGPGGLDRCLSGLDEATAILETLISSGPFPLEKHLIGKIPAGQRSGNPALAAALHRIRRSSRLLRLQIEFASNFWKGWLQRRVGTGYTNLGLPVFVDPTARSFEG